MIRFKTSAPFTDAVQDESGNQVDVRLFRRERFFVEALENDGGTSFNDEKGQLEWIDATDLATIHGYGQGVGETLRRLPWENAKIEGDELLAEIAPTRFGELETVKRDEWPSQ